MANLTPRKKTPRRSAILAVLRDRGPMTSQAVAEMLDWPAAVVTYTIATARRTRPGEMFRIVRYAPRVGEWGDDMAVFSAAGGKDLERKLSSRSVRTRAARKRHREKYLEVYRAKDRARHRATNASSPVVNPWLQLADKSVRARMGQVAANTSMAAAA